MKSAHGADINEGASMGEVGSQTLLADPTDREFVDRFVQLRDEQAFAGLVRRHGGMVFGVCRRILENTQDAEDAFQATFVVLARKAAAVERPELLANWLYGVAYRIARKAKAQAARRKLHERQAVAMTATESPPAGDDGREIRALLDQELQQLPAKYRVPLVLCYLEGLTNEEAARRLGWPSGSISYRLARGRDLLRDRLAQRQGAFAAAHFDAMLAEATVPPGISEPLIEATVKTALGDAGRPNLAPGLVALLAFKTPLSGLPLRAITALLITIAVAGLVAVGASAFGFSPTTWLSPEPVSTGSPAPTCGCH